MNPLIPLTILFASLLSSTANAQQQPAAAQNDSRIGKRVIVIVDRAPLRTPEKTVWRAYRGEVFTVATVNKEWLWITEKQGWLLGSEAVMFDTAIKELTERLQKEPTAENYDLRGIALTAHARYQDAVNDFSKSLQLKGNVPGVFNNRGRAAYLAKSYDNAIRDFNAAIKLNPKHFVALLNRALCLMATERYDEALKDLNAALSINKSFPEALNNRGVVYSQKRDYRKAVADFTAAIKVDERYVEAYGNRAATYRQMKRFNSALEDLQTAMKLAPTSHRPVNDVAWYLATTENQRQRNAKQAVEYALKACQMTSYEDWNTLDTLAAAYASAGQFKLAQQWIATAIDRAPEGAKKRLERHQQLVMSEKLITP